MTHEQHNAWPLLPQASGELETFLDENGHIGHRVVGEPSPEIPWCELRQQYEARRRAWAEAIGRPISDERGSVWPR